MQAKPRQHLVFVYGTLLGGEGNHGLLVQAQPLGPAATEPRYDLVDLGGYPGMVAGGNTEIRGELYEIDDMTLARLDALEGHPNFYQRQHVRLCDGRRVEAYVLPREQARGCPRIASGDWRRGEDAQDAAAG